MFKYYHHNIVVGVFVVKMYSMILHYVPLSQNVQAAIVHNDNDDLVNVLEGSLHYYVFVKLLNNDDVHDDDFVVPSHYNNCYHIQSNNCFVDADSIDDPV
jgi:hypothetical protein